MLRKCPTNYNQAKQDQPAGLILKEHSLFFCQFTPKCTNTLQYLLESRSKLIFIKIVSRIFNEI